MAKYRKNIIVSVVVLILLTVITVSLTFSWFQDYSANKGEINKISVSSGDMLLVSVDGGVTFIVKGAVISG